MERTVPTPPAVKFTVGLNTWAHAHPMRLATCPFDWENENDGTQRFGSHIGAWCEDCERYIGTTKGKAWIGEVELPIGVNKEDLPIRAGN